MKSEIEQQIFEKMKKNFLNFLPQMYNSSTIVALAGNARVLGEEAVK